MAWPTITDLGTVPSRTQTPATFSANANAFLGALPTFRTELNSFGAYGDSFQTTVEGYKTSAELAQTAAETAQGLAEDARDAALASANYKGSWSALTGALNIPASVSHDNVVWNLNTNLADVTSSEPSPTNTNWTAINGIAYNVVEKTTTGSISPVRNTFYHTGSLAGDVTTILPAAADSEGLVLLFKKLEASHTWTIDGNASETIDGETTYALTDQYEFVCLCCDGTNWNIASQTTQPATVKAIPDTIADITSSQTWTVPAGIGRIKIVAIGGGGDGGDATYSSSETYAGGGGGGGMSIKVLDVTPADSIVIDITSGVTTVTHTPTSLNMVANKGDDGVDVTDQQSGAGGSGGTASGGDINITGGSGNSAGSAAGERSGGAGGAIGRSEGMTNAYISGVAFSSCSCSFFVSFKDLTVPTSVGDKNSVDIHSPSSTFANWLLFGATERFNKKIFNVAASSGGVNGLIAHTYASGNGQNGSETSSGSGGYNGDYVGGNGGSVGAGGGGAVRRNIAGTSTGGSGGSAHCYIIY